MTSGLRDENGTVAPSRLTLLLIVVVAIAGATYVATTPDPSARATTTVASTQTPMATPTATPKATPKAGTLSATTTAPLGPAVKRGEVYVEVFNNSGVSGLAGRTATKVQGVGWKVVGSDNWYGTIPATTVYYPPRLKAAAKVLGRDLGITRLKPAVAPMRFDRLTVILTTDYTP